MSEDGAEILPFSGPDAFARWLEENVDHQPGVWLKLAKAGTGIPSLTSDEAVDVGLCFGWISGQRRRLDDTFYLQKYVPRRPRSRWSLVNVRKVEQLLGEGRMRPAGLAEVAAAQADGRWAAAYESQREFTVPEDLAAALAATPPAEQVFESLGRSEQYGFVLDIVTARTEEGRAARIRKVVRGLAGR